MKRLVFFTVLLAIVTISGTQSAARRANLSHKESAKVEFKTPVKLMNVLLQGEYLFVHDDELMAQGDACTYVFKMVEGRPVELVASFHCVPVIRKKVSNFTMRSSLVSAKPELYELQEFQFAGSSEGHQVPAKTEASITGVVDLAGCCP